MNVKIEPSWKEALQGEFEKPYFAQIAAFLHQQKKEGKTIYPPGPLIFNAFNLTPFDRVKVVILGQDPYHNPGQAEGLSFSVPEGVRIPPSLITVYKEMSSDLGVPVNRSGSLKDWAAQGVFLLNAILTVQAGLAASHSGIGWQMFTDAVISTQGGVLGDHPSVLDHIFDRVLGEIVLNTGIFLAHHILMSLKHDDWDILLSRSSLLDDKYIAGFIGLALKTV